MKKTALLIIGLVIVISAHAATLEGFLDVSVAEDLKNKKTVTSYTLYNRKQNINLIINSKLKAPTLNSGDNIKVEGEILSQQDGVAFKVNKIHLIKRATKGIQSNIGVRKPIIMIANFTNFKSTDDISAQAIEHLLYDGNGSVNSNILRNSFYQTRLDKDANGDNKADIYVVDLDYPAQNCNTSKWFISAEKKLKSQGVNFSLYQHKILIFPKQTSCWWAGRASRGCDNNCTAYIKSYSDGPWTRHLYAHEIGHNLGHAHSASDINNDGSVVDEYGDQACIMGQSGYLKEMNAPQRDQLGYFNNFPTTIKTVTQGDYAIYPLEGLLPRNGQVALRIPRGKDDYYYLSYRTQQGPFGEGAQQYMNRVSIHHASKQGGLTYFIKSLNAGEVFDDVTRRVMVRVNDISADRARVSVINY